MPARLMRSHTRSYIADLTCLVIMLAPILLISLFNHPVGDDFWLSALVRQKGIAGAFEHIYSTVSSRYAATTIMSINPLVFGNFSLYKVIPILFIAVFWFSSYSLLKSLVIESAVSARRHIDLSVISLAFTTTFFAVIPGIGEGLFWLSSLTVYLLGIVYAMWWLKMSIEWHVHGKQKWTALTWSGIFFLLLCGSNEIFALLGCGAIFLWFTSLIVRRKRPDSFISLHLILAIIVIVVVLASPSLQSRHSFGNFNPSLKWFTVLFRSLSYIVYHIGKVLINPFFGVGVLVITPAIMRISHISIFKQPQKRQVINMLLIAAVICIVLETTAVAYSANNVAPLRISNIVVWVFLVSFFLLLAFAILKDFVFARMLKIRIPLMAILLAVGFLFNNNTSIAFRELVNGTVKDYDRQMKNRFQLLKSCGIDTCKVPHLHNVPVTLRYSEHDDVQHLSRYFKTNIIVEQTSPR